MTEQQYKVEKLKLLMGGQTIRQFYNQTLKSLKVIEKKLDETPSLMEELLPQFNHKVYILELLKRYTKEKYNRVMTETEILEGFKC